MTHVVVVGAGQAGSALALKLRALGHTGEITLIGNEHVLPYQRPPLSKAYLLGDMKRERLFFRPQSGYEKLGISVRTGSKVTSIDPQGRRLSIGEEQLRYDELVLTTGSSPIRLPAKIGGNLNGVYCVRTLEDIDAMAPNFYAGQRVLIVGGGYIGLEAAAAARKKGLTVTVVEKGERILQRVSSPHTSDYFRGLHQSQGVTILEDVGLSSLEGQDSASQASLSNGQILDVDFVVIGIGIRPNTELADAAGLTIDNGIMTNAFGRTSAKHIWAAGDCASFPMGKSRIRLESVPNAISHAEVVAANIMGANTEYIAKPWFWSDQYETKLQIAGLNTGYESVVVRDGDKIGSVSHWYYSGEKLLSIDAINAPREYFVGKMLIDRGKSPSPDLIASPKTVLKSLL